MGSRLLVMLLLVGCAPDPTPADLACASDDDCAEWGAFAPYCRVTYVSSVGVCSECAADPDCGDDHICEANADGFGTCLAGSRT